MERAVVSKRAHITIHFSINNLGSQEVTVMEIANADQRHAAILVQAGRLTDRRKAGEKDLIPSLKEKVLWSDW